MIVFRAIGVDQILPRINPAIAKVNMLEGHPGVFVQNDQPGVSGGAAVGLRPVLDVVLLDDHGAYLGRAR